MRGLPSRPLRCEILAAFLSLTVLLPGCAAAAALHPTIRVVQFQTAAATNAAEIAVIPIGKPVDRELMGGQTHSYQLAMAAGEYADITVEHRGIDLGVQIRGPDQSVIAEFEDVVGNEGKENAGFVAAAAGVYTLTIKAKMRNAPPGAYELLCAAKHSANDSERALHESRNLRTSAAYLEAAGKYDDALALTEQALAIAEKTPGVSPVYVALLIKQLGLIYDDKHDRENAKASFERSLEILEKELGPEHPLTASVENRVGAMYETAGNYVKAEELQRHALQVEEKVLGPEHLAVGLSLRSLGVLYSDLGDLEKSRQNQERALTIISNAKGTDNFNVAELQNNIGVIFSRQRNYAEARPYLERALATQERLFGADNIQITAVLQNLGIIAREQKRYADAEKYYLRALAIRERVLGPEDPEVALTLINIANVYHAQGDEAKSLEIRLRVLKVLEKTDSPDEWDMILSLGNVAKSYAALGDLKNAVAFQSRVDDAIEARIAANLVIGSERQKVEFLNQISERTERTVSLNLQLAPQDPNAAALAARVLLQRKGRVLDAMTDSFDALKQHSDPEDHALLDQLRTTTAQIARVVLNGTEKVSLSEYRKSLAELKEKREKLEAEISRHSAEFRSASQPIMLETIQSTIPAKTALLEFVAYRPFDPKAASNSDAYAEPHYAVYVIRRTGVPQGRDLGDAKQLQLKIEKFRQALRDPLSTEVHALSRDLDETLLSPIRPLLADAQRLLISPDGDLNLIPFEALLDDQEHYLVQRYSISYLTTGRDLLRMQVERASKSKPVVIADPAFGEPQPLQIASLGEPSLKPASHTLQRRSITSAEDLSGVYFARLAGTAEEAQTIKSLFPDANVLTGPNATKAAVKQADAPSILHIATHGFFLGEASQKPANATRGINAKVKIENPLLRSGLALAGANNRKDSADNGIFTALEASSLNLWGTKLVTLSACDTGVGEVKNGEGVYGLRRAFILSGTETLVMSLWPVSDYVTREVMTTYYKGLKNGLGRGEALRQAELTMMKHKGREHPFYWASFIQSGEWGNLKGKR